ncbi:MAG: hypothetical protein U9P12_07125 [Verrucomicrobiota bacterium]|nr:hypothetical protein [Verrucomicrobiota bacterium]
MKRKLPDGLVCALLLTFGCAKKNEFQAPPAPEVTVQNPEQKDVTVYTGFPGRLVISLSAGFFVVRRALDGKQSPRNRATGE